MTTTSEDEASAQVKDGTALPGRRRPSGPLLVAGAAGIVAMICAVLLPLLPVAVERPVVSWPPVPGVPESTALGLTTQRPLVLDAAFGCRDARAATTGPVLATAPTGFPDAERAALIARATDGTLGVTSRGTPLYEGPLPAGDCTVTVHGDLSVLELRIDGTVVGTLPGEALPDVDALVSAAPAPAGVEVRLALDDQGATSPTAVKVVATALLGLALATSLVALAVADRAAAPRAPRRWRRPALVDVVVPAVMLVWLFLAPMTDDDGYYSAMASNVPHAGYVANYFQLYNQGFTPFTWIYYALSAWQGVFGTAPVVLRIPALLFGLVTWFTVRTFLARAVPDGGWTARALRITVGVCFLGWWLPYDMGVRPEAVVAAGTVLALLGMSVAIERGRLLPAGLAVLASGVAFTAGTAGFVALAPLLATAPAFWRMLREQYPSTRWAALVAVVAAGSVVGLLAFADGSLRDFTRAQQIFLGLQYPESWSTEIVRWDYLLDSPGAMSNYAKRLPVLLTLLALGGFLLGAAATRGHALAWPDRVRTTAVSTALGLLLLWLTPSKWTHHFGALAGIGAVLLAAVTVYGIRLAQQAVADRRPTGPLAVAALLLLAVLVALAGRGDNLWPYSWMLGIPHPGTPPQVSVVAFGQPVWWLLGAAAVTAVAAVLLRRRDPARVPLAPWIAVPVVVCTAFLGTTGYMVGGFALAAVRTHDTYSPWADALEDPLARRCGAEQEVQALDPGSARALPLAAPGEGSASGDAFVANAGWSPSSPPPVADVPVWGSHRPGPDAADPPDGAGSGTITTPWYSLPADPEGLSFYLAGRAGEDNDVRVEYASAGLSPLEGFDAVGQGREGAPVDAREWRSVSLSGRWAPPAGAEAVRLVAADRSDGVGGWTAVSAPVVQRWVPLARLVRPGSATAVGWSIAFLFPCLRTPVQALGVNEPVTLAVTGGDEPLDGVGDSAFQPERGGLYVPSYRGSVVTQLSARLAHFPDRPGIQVYTLRGDLPHGRYDLRSTSEVVPGWAPAPNTTFSQPVGPERVVRP
ncbi:arabinosyltransferase domain-containing protein [Actinomycetospora sp. OC33-EN08]|uniref:Arabinosyltransferase domain-containing protein n=1 Tax=Actinomycetospora aurantiaca TaxID=3129233 RepID=A0ABU8MSV1_9PSEU